MSQISIPTAEQYALFKSTNFCEFDTNGSYTPTNNPGHLPTSHIGTGAIMISSTFILAFLASKALVEAAPAKTNTISYPEVITIHPPKIMTTKTTKTMTWPDGFLNLPGRTSTITKTISLLPLHARETGGVSLERTETTAVLFGEALSALPMPTEDIGPSPVFISYQASLSADVGSTATHSGESAVGAKNVIEARGPQPEKTVFITITKEPTRSTVTPKSRKMSVAQIRTQDYQVILVDQVIFIDAAQDFFV
ncbi:hypothetical protein SLS58_007048 [Diplodia intermedia]|uniref:Uncharacterized protein n=1 Tax=Diplodia intermedia TaxID=856260 RepID=A0ABR3TLZ5_9PEZI